MKVPTALNWSYSELARYIATPPPVTQLPTRVGGRSVCVAVYRDTTTRHPTRAGRSVGRGISGHHHTSPNPGRSVGRSRSISGHHHPSPNPGRRSVGRSRYIETPPPVTQPGSVGRSVGISRHHHTSPSPGRSVGRSRPVPRHIETHKPHTNKHTHLTYTTRGRS